MTRIRSIAAYWLYVSEVLDECHACYGLAFSDVQLHHDLIDAMLRAGL